MDLRKAEDRDTQERSILAGSFLGLARCSGGRILVEGYVCHWCGNDDPSGGKCGRPDRLRQKEQDSVLP